MSCIAAHPAHLSEAADHLNAANDAGLQCAPAALIQQVHLVDANQGDLRRRSQLYVHVWKGNESRFQHETAAPLQRTACRRGPCACA